MLPADELKPRLLDRDWLVREAVARWFRSSWSRDPDLVPLVLEAVRRHPRRVSRHLLSLCDRFVLTPESLDRVVAALEDPVDEDTGLHLNRMLWGAPGPLLAANLERILGNPFLLEPTALRVERRAELATWPAEKLWDDLVELTDAARGRDASSIDFGRARDLVDALSSHGEVDAGRVLSAIAAHGEDWWLEVFAVELAGARGMREAVPALVSKLRCEGDYLHEAALHALARIGDPNAVDSIRAAYPHESFDFRLYASGVLGDLKCEPAEEALLALLPTERDVALRAYLCVALCEQFSARGLDLVLREIESGYDASVASLEEAVLPVADILGARLPRAKAWRAKAERERERTARALRDLDDFADDFPFAEDDEDAAPYSDADLDHVLAPVVPRVRTHPKIGRNAPCPCGSGRKYKRCCGRTW
jgi:hypothetical protein